MKNTIVTSHCFSSTSLDSADFMIECMHCSLVTLINIQLDVIGSIDSSLLPLSSAIPHPKHKSCNKIAPIFTVQFSLIIHKTKQIPWPI